MVVGLGAAGCGGLWWARGGLLVARDGGLGLARSGG
jgi:hypothetical protein